MLTYLRRARRALRRRLQMPDAYWRELLAPYPIPLEQVELLAGGNIRLRELDLEISKGREPLALLRGYEDARQLRKCRDAEFSWSGDDLLLGIAGLNHRIRTPEELLILSEIYVSGDYDLLLNRTAVVIDIGANVAFTSLFLAKHGGDLLIEAFEPVEDTYKAALRNIALNPDCKSRVKLRNVGLASYEGEAVIAFDPSAPGNSTLVRDAQCFTRAYPGSERVRLQKAAEVIREIIENNAGREVVLKLDCEGSEYEILTDLREAGLLSRIKCIIGEWHAVSDKASCETLRQLLAGEFSLWASRRFPRDAAAGMFLAWK